MFHLYNTISRSIEEFTPINPPHVGMYTCGMTVYDYSHIGHGRKYVGDDILRRILMRLGYDVTHVQNVTDVGHLASDGDEGEDKLEKGAKKQGKTVWEVAAFFTKDFFDTMAQLNILPPTISCKATDHIPEQIVLVETLIKKKLAYDTPEAVYFDVSKFPEYGKLFGQDLSEKMTAVRDSVQTGEYKKNPIDFALWFKRVGRFSDHAMHWTSPWGEGFPGWHIECSAMSMKYLGESFDIHTGGIDHVPVHHPNEIAQSEGATGKQFVKYWVHYLHLMVDGRKMSKSLGNFYRISDVVEKGYDPLALRYFYLSTHYRKSQNFTWEALTASQNALVELRRLYASFGQGIDVQLSSEAIKFQTRFNEALLDDMNTPQALAVLWETVKSKLPDTEKSTLIRDFDTVLALSIDTPVHAVEQTIPDEVQLLVTKRNTLRSEKKYAESDVVRKEIEEKGYILEDTANGTSVKKK
jgi:cysteinyl-tRNA synthetase